VYVILRKIREDIAPYVVGFLFFRRHKYEKKMLNVGREETKEEICYFHGFQTF